MPPDPAQSVAGARDEGDADTLDEALTLAAEAESLLRDGRPDDAVRVARRAAELGPDLDRAWRILAEACDAQGDLRAAADAYDEAARRAADRRDLNAPMGRLALQLGEYSKAERLLKAHLRENGPEPRAIADLAQAQARLLAFDRAHAVLKAALEVDPGQSVLWVALGELLGFQGRHAQSIVFFEEAARLDPDSASARSGLADALLLGAGDVDGAIAASEAAVAAATANELPALNTAHARRLLASGQLAAGWAAFAKAAEHGEAAAVDIRIAAPPWSPGLPDGPLLLLGEEDIVVLLLTHAAPDLVAEDRPLILAVDRRLQALARRSFPQVTVVPLLSRLRSGRRQVTAELDSPHMHAGQLLAAWRPLRGLVAERRRQPADFAATGPYLKPDENRVRHWRGWLSGLGAGPKVGLRWRQPFLDVSRPCEAPTLNDLHIPLSVPGLNLISLQDGEVMGEVEWIHDAMGLRLHEPPGLDRDDLDDLAALARALDIVVGPPGVTTYLAAACGAETWFLSTPWHWALLGGDTYPWFPEARVILADGADWTDAMHELGQALYARANASTDGVPG